MSLNVHLLSSVRQKAWRMNERHVWFIWSKSWLDLAKNEHKAAYTFKCKLSHVRIKIEKIITVKTISRISHDMLFLSLLFNFSCITFPHLKYSKFFVISGWASCSGLTWRHEMNPLEIRHERFQGKNKTHQRESSERQEETGQREKVTQRERCVNRLNRVSLEFFICWVVDNLKHGCAHTHTHTSGTSVYISVPH